MAYINTTTNAYPVSEQDIRNEFPNTSFSLPFQAPEGYAPVLESPAPAYDAMTQGYREASPAQDTLGNWVRVYSIYDLEPEQIANNEEQRKQSNKQQAMSLLSATDWTQMPDVDMANKDEFTAYRAALRAIAVNPPVTVSEWPVKPEEVWPEVA